VGAISGAYLRYRIGTDQISFLGIPITILIINVLGSFTLGLSMTTIQRFGLSQGYTLLLGVGFCGSFTTMSSFAYETACLFDVGKLLIGFVDIVLNVGLSILAVIAGRALVSILAGFL
jgi:CrcB protein